MDYTNCCRTCLSKSTKMTKMSSFVNVADTVVRLSDILANHYDYKDTKDADTFPTSICSRCVDHLTATFSFQCVLDSCTTTLENGIEPVEVKSEIEYEDSHYDNDIDIDLELKAGAEESSPPPSPPPPKVATSGKVRRYVKPVKVKSEIEYADTHYDNDNDLDIDIDLKLKANVEESSLPPSPPPPPPKVATSGKVRRYKKRRLMRRKPNSQANPAEEPVSTPLLNEFFCVECKKQFSTKESLREHCGEHPIKGSVGKDCELCDEKFATFKSLVIHKKLHAKPFLCLACWLGFYTESEMQTHNCTLIKKVPLSNEICQCDQCGKSYRRGYIKVHLKTHEEESKYSCKYCPKKFKIPSTLSSHVLYNHTRTRNFLCHICNATFMSASKRSTHIRKHHLHEKKYACELCDKRFFSKSELDRHKLTHTGVKNFHCHLCEKSYQTKYGLTVHLKSHGPMLNPVLNQ